MRYRIVFKYIKTGKVVRAGSSSDKIRQLALVKKQNLKHKGTVHYWIEEEE